jgi:thiamine biosynthesis lipoprotein
MNRRDFVGVLGFGLCSRWIGFRGVMVERIRNLDGERLVERWSWVMGQAVRLQVYARSDDAGHEAVGRVLADLRRLEAALSVFDDASDLSELNRKAGQPAVRVGADLTSVLRAAEEFRRLTGGGFNPAVEPLMRAWGFRAPRSTAPTGSEIEQARVAVARATVEVGEGRVRLGHTETRIDLGGIAVGYGLDRSRELLAGFGIRRALIDLSGDCLALGAPPGDRGWRIGIANPDGGILRTVLLRDAALATSANTVSVVRYGTTVCGHVLDPATGRSARALRQVSILAPTGIQADALSTAMLVSGRRPPGVTEVIPLPGRSNVG